jgi:hypothetical protein
MTHSVDFSILKTKTLLQENWVIGYSGKEVQRSVTTVAVWVQKASNIYMWKMCKHEMSQNA